MAGTVTVSVDKGCLRLQFPSAVSKKIWNVRQKYLALGLSDTPENRAMAQQLASQAQMDILLGNQDITLQRYKPFASEKILKQVKPKIPSLLELYTEFTESVLKPGLDQITFTQKYKGRYLNILTSCASADIVDDSTKIFDKIKAATTPQEARRVLDVLYNLLEWCKRREIVKKDTYNPYRSYKQDVPGKSKQVKPKHIIEQGLVEDDDYRGYSPEEADYIIKAFSFRGDTPNLYYSFVLFLFLTGCRPSEAVGLQWGDINTDCSVITFCHVYCSRTKEEKGLKTKRFGKVKRSFPCGERLQNLLKEMREKQDIPHPKSKVFLTIKGNPISWASFYNSWSGKHNNHNNTNGVIEILAREGKVGYYLKPYATRHSFITWQLAYGMTPANVAKLVGNTPEMIYKHYVSADEDIKLAFEI
jgi:integrase